MTIARVLIHATLQVDLFRDLGDKTLELMRGRMWEESYGEGETVIQQGEFGENFYVILQGAVTVTRSEFAAPGAETEGGRGEMNSNSGSMHITDLTEGSYFGERSLLLDELTSATITAKTNLEVVTISRREFQEELAMAGKNFNDLAAYYKGRICKK